MGVKDHPADPAQLARLLKVANNGAGLSHLRLGMDKTKCMVCDRCDLVNLCRARLALSLWAPCEAPWQHDLLTLTRVLEERTMTDGIPLHERLVEARERAGLTQGELAAKLGLAPIIIAGFESGAKMPSQVVLMGLALGVNLMPKQLLEGVTVTNAMRRRYASLLDLKPVEYSGDFALTVTVHAGGEDRDAITNALKQGLSKARRQLTKLEAWEEIPAQFTIES